MDPVDKAPSSWREVIQPETRRLLAELLGREAERFPVAVGIYARISKDKGHDARGVARHIDQAVARIAREPGWRLAFPPFVDNDLSATKGAKGKPRPEYNRIMAAVGRGELRVIVLYMSSRLWRNRKQRAEAMEPLAQWGVLLAATQGSDLDLSTPSGRMVAGILGEVDSHEVEQNAVRIRDEIEQRARHGLPAGTRLYGYTTDRQIIADQATIIRTCVEKILDPRQDRSITSLVAEMNDAGVPTQTGDARWQTSTLRELLRNPELAGLRTYHRKVVATGQWEPIISPETHARLVARLSRHTMPPGWSNRTRHLLPGIATCGRCGAGMLYRGPQGRTKASYICPPAERGGCRGVRRQAAPVDLYVETTVVGLLSQPGILAELVREDAADPMEAIKVAADIEAAQARATALGEQMADDDPRDEVTKILRRSQAAKIRADLAEARARQAQMTQSGAFDGLLDVEDIAAHWESLSLPRRRAIIRAMVTVTILPTGRGRTAFNTDTVQIKRRSPSALAVGPGQGADRADQVTDR
ncbi:recombinase family protein [Pseudofrankia sp. BMG5.37]|uniref:recombinase family protein n=1 Tax=Pseudofrankia sp. BMG5.37 TaxID=3050035 RepID=UPI0028954A7B|nr:recombinase family protein [Pseudofrankia sp. BMG5.37]MDT3439123.1 recombinase family protein [Pseudofrankia sp. BMG5.37]